MTTWVKIHNSMPAHPKMLMAGDRASWLFVCGCCYSNEHLTDGFIARHVLPVAAPGVKNADRLAGALVKAGLWHEVEGGWRIHDYKEHQRSSGEIRERRAKDAERHANRRAVSNGSPHGQTADTGADSIPESAENPPGVRTAREKKAEEKAEIEELLVVAAPPQGDQDRVLDEQVTFLCALMSTEVRASHGIEATSREALVVKGWRDACRAMLTSDGYSSEQLEYAVRWVCRHHYWRNRIKSFTRLRSEMGQVVSQIRREQGGEVVQIRGRKGGPSDLIRKLDESEAL